MSIIASNKSAFLAATIFLMAVSGAALIYSVATYSDISAGHVVIIAPPTLQEIQVPLTIDFGELEAGDTSQPVPVKIVSTVNSPTTVTVSSSLQTLEVHMSEGTSVILPANSELTVHVSATDLGTPLGEHLFTVTFTAAEA